MALRSVRIAQVCLALLVASALPVLAQTTEPRPPPPVDNAAHPAVPAIPVAVEPPPAPPPPSLFTPPMVDRDDVAQASCDGYGQMLPSGDGVTVATANIMRVGGNRVRGRVDMANGVAYCDRALRVLEAQYPQFWQRKVSFLQARALHRIAARDFDGAAADIAAADAAAVSPDAAHLRSFGLNTRFIEAFLLVERGERAGGETLAMQSWRQRPYTRQSIYLALMAIGPDGDRANIETLLHAMGQIDPNGSMYLYTYEFEMGAFDQALALADDLTPRRPLPPNTYDFRARTYHEERQRALNIRFWIEMLGRKAYMLAAHGQADAANAVLADLDQRLAQSTPAPTPLPERPNREQRTRAAVQEQVNLEITSSAPQRLAAWRTLVAARLDVAAGRPRPPNDQIGTAVTAVLPSYAAAELFAASGDANAHGPSPAEIYRGLGLPPHDAATMFQWLYDGETPDRMRQVLGWLDGMFANRGQREHGNCEESQDGAHAEVCDWAAESTMAISEERAMLRAARFARAQGQPSFIVTKRMDSQHVNVATMYGTPINQSQAGFSTTLTIDARPAPTSDSACWRCLDAAAVEDSLTPLYVPPNPTPRN